MAVEFKMAARCVDKRVEDMVAILTKLGLETCIEKFRKERITPDVVMHLSDSELRTLSVNNSQDVMRLRTECITFSKPENNLSGSGVKFHISKNVLQGPEIYIETGYLSDRKRKYMSRPTCAKLKVR